MISKCPYPPPLPSLLPLSQLSGIRCVVVHGGGPAIASMLEKLEIPTRFEQGLRVTDEVRGLRCAGGRGMGMGACFTL